MSEDVGYDDFHDEQSTENSIPNDQDINLDIVSNTPKEKATDDFYEIIIIKKYKCKSCELMLDSFEQIHDHYTNVHNNKDQTTATKLQFIDATNNDASFPNKCKKNINDISPKNKRTKKRLQQTRKYPCDWPDCDYVAINSVHLKDHRRIHTGEKPYRCDWNDCGHSFTQLSSLRLHIRTHTGERPYECDWPDCNMRFTQKSNLKVHMRKHTGERPYSCDWPGCEANFSVKGNLEHHRKAHCGLKIFVCDHPNCGRTFVENAHLRKHEMIHQDNKPYKCDWPGCNYSSCRRIDVNNHKLIHSGQFKRFHCPHCPNKQFTRSHLLHKHVQKTHFTNT